MLAIQPQDLNRDRIKAYFDKKGYIFWEGGDFDLNIIGVRNKVPKVNEFNDALMCIWKEQGQWKQGIWPATTDPGLYYLNAPINVKGTAILCPGQYRSSHSVGLHQNKYEALVQVAPVKVWRDANRDNKLDFDGEVDEGYFGINIHHAAAVGTPDADAQGGTNAIENYSAGCQVFQNIHDFDTFMILVKRAAAVWGSTFTFTLISQLDL